MAPSSKRTAYLVDGVRTPIGKYAGSLSNFRTDDLAAHAISQLLKRHETLDTEAIEEIVLGCANQAGEDNRNVARMATLLAGLPVTTSGVTVNRLCGSGLDAIAMAAHKIVAGGAEMLITGGVESMSRAPFVIPKSVNAFGRNAEIYDTTIGWRFINRAMENNFGVDSMPETAENVAEEDGISRQDQDSFALRSQQRAATAISNGRLAREITPVPTNSRKGDAVVSKDEFPRETSLEALGRLPTPFRANGSVTAGNASGINDGAAALLIASESAVNAFGLEPLARITSSASIGVEPRLMGLGPVPAMQKLLRAQGLVVRDIDVLELNEAFASQSLACLRRLGLPDDAEHVNPNGGAIALGHPLGMSGARIALSAAIELKDRQAQRAAATMCVGVGQGIAMLLERV